MAVYKMTPTKANLIKAKSSLEFSKKGFELLDRKRTVLIREMMTLIEKANELEQIIDTSFRDGYEALKLANITMGTENMDEISLSFEREKDYNIIFKSVMGVETPIIKRELDSNITTESGLFRTNLAFDNAVLEFIDMKSIIYNLAEVESTVFKLALEIKKTQKRANALEKIQIPRYEKVIKYIDEVLEEKEREDFFRLKRVKGNK